jgi:tetratricopeptide (TPR) repeat protein
MRAFFRARPCSHFIFIQTLGSLSEMNEISANLRGIPCDICGCVVDDVDVLTDPDTFQKQIQLESTPDQARLALDFTRHFLAEDKKKSQLLLRAIGGRPTRGIEVARRAVLKRVPTSMQEKLSLIPVGLHSSHSPNAKTIFFRNESTVPIIVFHWGLTSYIFRMNISILPTLPITCIGEEQKEFKGVGRPTLGEDDGTRMSIDAVKRFLFEDVQVVDMPPLTDPHKALEMALHRTIAMFVLAHEYGHAVLAHNTALAQYVDNSEAYERAVQAEFEADVWAQDLVSGRFAPGRSTLRSDPVSELADSDMIVQAAPLVFFLYAEFLNRFELAAPNSLNSDYAARSIPALREALSLARSRDDHPQPMERFARMQELLESRGHWQARTLVRVVSDVVSSRLEALFGKGLDVNLGRVVCGKEKRSVSATLEAIANRATFRELERPVLTSLAKMLNEGLKPPTLTGLAGETSKSTDQAHALYEAAMRLSQGRQFKKAIAALQKAVELVDNALHGVKYETVATRDLRIVKSGCHFELGDILSPFNAAGKGDIKVDATAAEAHFLSAIACAYSYLIEKADLRMVFCLSLRQISNLRRRTGNHEGEREAAELMVRVDPDVCDGWIRLGEVFLQKDSLEPALECYVRATKTESGSKLQGLAYWNAADLVLRKGDVRKAGEYLATAVKDHGYRTVDSFVAEVQLKSAEVIQQLQEAVAKRGNSS